MMAMDTQATFEQLFRGTLGEEEARAFLIALYEKGESGKDIATAASIMRRHSIKLDVPDELQEKLIDVVGTGGDQSGSFNVSSTVALLLASIGAFVAKHGNRSITSKSGSADMLEALDINLNLTPKAQVEMLEETGFCFIFAINHHPAMKHIMPIRKSIPHRTVFNILGPLTNPAGAKRYLLGVFDPSYVQKMAEALVQLGAKKAYVVSSQDGMDEISLGAPTRFALVQEGSVQEGIIEPESLGFQKAPKEAILGGDATDNAKITRSIFDGSEHGAKRDMVVLNAIYALLAADLARDEMEAKQICQEALDSKQALRHLDKIITVSNKLA